jgi:hypothetical protein
MYQGDISLHIEQRMPVSPKKVGVVGATGAVGMEMVKVGIQLLPSIPVEQYMVRN